MPEKHLFVNASHYQDRPDPKMRHKIASHAAKYGPNGSLAFKISPERSIAHSFSDVNIRHVPIASKGGSGSQMQRSSSVSSNFSETRLRQDYEAMLSRFDDFCACTDSTTKDSRMKGKVKHSEVCSLLDTYLAFCSQLELPFRVFPYVHDTSFWPLGSLDDKGLVFQCYLVATQAAIDGLDSKFKGKASKQTLTLQQKALLAIQRVIASRPNTIDDSLVLSCAILMSVAAYFDEQDAYKAHKSSLQKMIDSQGGPNQTRTHRMIRSISSSAEVSLAIHRYTDIKQQITCNKKDAATVQPTASTSSPLKLKYPMPPFSPDLNRSISKLTPGFQALANASKISVQGLQLLSLVYKWSLLMEESASDDIEHCQLLTSTLAANARLFDIYTDTMETRRLAAFILLSIPGDAAHMKLERCICLALLQLLHSLTLEQFTLSTRDRLALDFTDTLLSFSPKDEDEESCVIWLAITMVSEWRYCAMKAAQSSILEELGLDIAVHCQSWTQRSKQVMDWVVMKCERARTWEDTASACENFLWSRTLSNEWKVTWKDTMERRMRNMPRKKNRNSP